MVGSGHWIAKWQSSICYWFTVKPWASYLTLCLHGGGVIILVVFVDPWYGNSNNQVGFSLLNRKKIEEERVKGSSYERERERRRGLKILGPSLGKSDPSFENCEIGISPISCTALSNLATFYNSIHHSGTWALLKKQITYSNEAFFSCLLSWGRWGYGHFFVCFNAISSFSPTEPSQSLNLIFIIFVCITVTSRSPSGEQRPIKLGIVYRLRAGLHYRISRSNLVALGGERDPPPPRAAQVTET